MNDPWDVKSVRRSNQYISCMKLNGVPLLPPVLSRECRKEMQYYKVLSKEVEKRISILKPFVSGDCDSVDDKTDGKDVPGQSFELPLTNSEAGFDFNINKILALPSESYENKDVNTHPSKVYQSITSNVTVTSDSTVDTPKLIIDLSLSIKEGGKSILTSIHKSPQSPGTRTPPSPPLEPEHDCAELEFDIPQKELMNEVNTISEKVKCLEETVNRAFNHESKSLADPFLDGIPLRNEGPSSLSSKSFTGSLHDIHSVSAKDPEVVPTLIRQHSYTVLNPSPQLLAHLEVQSLNTGVEVTSISMSDSQSNIDSNTNGKKRRSWDLESAKVKWSSMALELKGTGIPSAVKPKVHGNATSAVSQSVVGQNASLQNKLTPKKVPSTITPPSKVRSAALDYARKSTAIRSPQKSEPIHRPHTMPNTQSNKMAPKEPLTAQSKTVTKEATPKMQTQQTETKTDKEAEGDPAIRIRELYEKIQKQQLAQMANLIEKQKREQMFLQRVFEEQNNMLCSQLKTICPKVAVEINKALTDNDNDRGPVSLSQLIDAKSPDRGRYEGPADTLQMTNNCINKCDNVLKQSKNITSSIRKLSPRVSSVNGRTVLTPDVGRTSTTSPSIRNASRKLNYDSAASTDVDLMLTDRTNDTLADLQSVSFPSDVEETQLYHEAVTVQPKTQSPRVGSPNRTTDSAIRSLEHTIKNSINSMSSMNGNCNRRPANQTSSFRVATSKEREAATRIVAHAKGYLVRRLMRTERVQATVQTIRDALLCALELHKDREGIRGADVDLHRRLIQQITAACYTLHDAFVGSSPAERCAAIAADRRRRAAPRPQPSPSMARALRHPDIMSQSHSGSFPARTRRASSASIMTQSTYETFNIHKCNSARYMPSPRRRPWR